MDKLEELGVGSWVNVDARVVRGIDWAGGNADGHQGGTGKGLVTKVGWCRSGGTMTTMGIIEWEQEGNMS